MRLKGILLCLLFRSDTRTQDLPDYDRRQRQICLKNSAYPIAAVRQRLPLPMHFGNYPISDGSSLHSPVSPYSIAIGQSALLLDTLAHRFKGQGGEVWIC